VKKPNRSFRKTPLAAAITATMAFGSHGASAQDSDLVLEEVVVTATRRAQSVTEVPYNITAVTGDALEQAGVSDLAGVMKSIPGVVFADMGDRANAVNSGIVLRGLSTQPQANANAIANLTVPSVSTYMDNTPLAINLKLTDIERVEVLRGPQGTLYGSGSLGGTIRFIHAKPNPDGFEASFATGVEFDGESDDQSYNVDAVFNVPISDNAAFRVAATWDDRAGVIDVLGVHALDSNGHSVLADPNDFIGSPAVQMTVKDSDTSESVGVRASLGVDFTDNVNMLLVHHFQNLKTSGDGFRDVGGTTYEQNTAFVNQFDQDISLTSLELEADLGFATLTSSTSFTEIEQSATREITPLKNYLDSIPQYYLGLPYSSQTLGCLFYGCFPRGTMTGNEPFEREDFTQELRLVSNSDGAVDWLVGAYYTDQDAALIIDQQLPGWATWTATPGSGNAVLDAYLDFPQGYLASVGAMYDFNNYWAAGVVSTPTEGVPVFFNDRTTQYEETSIYGEVTFHISDAWQTTFGARFFDQTYKSRLVSIFTNCGAACSTDGVDLRGFSDSSTSQSDTGSIFKFNTSYALNDDHNLYFTWAEGYRHGGTNALPVGYDGLTEAIIPYKQDETTNWEFGVKGHLMNGQMQYTAAAYLIEWKNPQIDGFIALAALPGVVNADEAESRGLELALNGNLSDSVSFDLGYTYTDAEITKDFSVFIGNSVAPVSGPKGSGLPGVAEHQANFALNYFKPDAVGGFGLLGRIDGRYKSEAQNDLSTGINFGVLDAYSIFNGSIGLQNDNWTITAFVNNLGDETDAVTAFALTAGYSVEAIERGRSYGLRVKYDF